MEIIDQIIYFPRFAMDVVHAFQDWESFILSFLSSTGFPAAIMLLWETEKAAGAFFKRPQSGFDFMQIIAAFYLARFALSCLAYLLGKKVLPKFGFGFTGTSARNFAMFGFGVPFFGWLLPALSANSYQSFQLFCFDVLTGSTICFVAYNLLFSMLPPVVAPSAAVYAFCGLLALA